MWQTGDDFTASLSRRYQLGLIYRPRLLPVSFRGIFKVYEETAAFGMRDRHVGNEACKDYVKSTGFG